jgi:hypothetical protein
MVAATRRTRRACRGRPAKTDPPPTEAGYRLVVEVKALAKADADNGWTGLATTVDAEVGTNVEILQAYQDQNATVEPGFRCIKSRRRSARGGGRSPNALRPWPGSRSWAYWCMRCSHDRFASLSVSMTGPSPATKVRRPPPRQRWCLLSLRQGRWSTARWTMRLSYRSMASGQSISSCVTYWVSPMPGIRERQRGKMRCCQPHLLERGLKLNDHQLKAGGFKSFRRTSPPTERENG